MRAFLWALLWYSLASIGTVLGWNALFVRAPFVLYLAAVATGFLALAILFVEDGAFTALTGVDPRWLVAVFVTAFVAALFMRELPLRSTNTETVASPATEAGTEGGPQPRFRESPVTD